jgi:hypothetical protein
LLGEKSFERLGACCNFLPVNVSDQGHTRAKP